MNGIRDFEAGGCAQLRSRLKRLSGDSEAREAPCVIQNNTEQGLQPIIAKLKRLDRNFQETQLTGNDRLGATAQCIPQRHRSRKIRLHRFDPVDDNIRINIYRAPRR